MKHGELEVSMKIPALSVFTDDVPRELMILHDPPFVGDSAGQV